MLFHMYAVLLIFSPDRSTQALLGIRMRLSRHVSANRLLCLARAPCVPCGYLTLRYGVAGSQDTASHYSHYCAVAYCSEAYGHTTQGKESYSSIGDLNSPGAFPDSDRALSHLQGPPQSPRIKSFQPEGYEDRLSSAHRLGRYSQVQKDVSAMTRDILLSHGADVLNYVEGPVNPRKIIQDIKASVPASKGQARHCALAVRMP